MRLRGCFSLVSALVIALTGQGCSTVPEGQQTLVSLTDLDPSIWIDMRYAGSNNFVGTPIDGYAAPVCLLTRPAALRLIRVNRALRTRGLALIVYDCYRPQRAVAHFVRWAADRSDRKTKWDYYPYVPKSELVKRGYIADKSSHSRGSTVAVGLLRLYGTRQHSAWEPADMGTPFDYFDERSRTDSPFITSVQRLNRMRLREVMEESGFRNRPDEWWHFTLKDEPYPDTYFNFMVQ
jgi:D-alanyl-D-alanine dipeptidase